MAGNKAGKSVLSRRYAKALFGLASEQNKLDDVAKDLIEINKMVESSDDLQKVLKSPIISKEKLSGAIQVLFRKAGISVLTMRFCDLLGENRRLTILPEISKQFAELLAEAKGEVVAEVISASSLSANDEKKITARLEKATEKRVRLKKVVNEDIIGGLILKVGSGMLDSSIGGRLDRLKLHLKGTGD